MLTIRVLLAMAVLIPALLLLRLAAWICPENHTHADNEEAMSAELKTWMNVPQGLDERVQ